MISNKRLFLWKMMFGMFLSISVMPSLFAQSSRGLLSPPWDDSLYSEADFLPVLAKPLDIGAKSYLLLDMSEGVILTSYNINAPHIMASLAKLMTAYVVLQSLERGDIAWQDRYEVTKESIAIPQDASRMGLGVGDTPSVEELLEGLLIASGNDAAIMLAHITYGSMNAFVTAMNLYANQMELTRTHFAETSGLSVKNVSTAMDLAILSYHLLSLPFFDITSITHTKKFLYHHYKSSTNLLLNTYEGVDGLKTGYIEESGFNFIVSAQRNYEGTGNRRLLAVILGVPAHTIAEGVVKRAKMAETLLDFGFNQFTPVALGYTPQKLRVWGGTSDFVRVHTETQRVLIPSSWIDNIQVSFESHEPIWAPVGVEDMLATARVYVTLASLSVTSPQAVDKTEKAQEKELVPHTNIQTIPLVSLPFMPQQGIEKASFFLRVLDFFISSFQKEG